MVPVTPTPWQRARLSAAKKFFDGQVKNKVAFGIYLSKQHNNEPLFDSAISVELNFYFQPPKNRHEPFFHTTKPDLDNLQKFVLDAIKDILIADDKLICSITAHKKYDKEPRTEIVITEVK